jgi:pre-mRNA-processing factor 6
LWLRLAKLEEFDEAKNVLNNAISTIPTDHTIWISAAKLEESQGNTKKVSDIVKRAFKKLIKMSAEITREQWLQEAIDAQELGSPHTSEAIIKEFLNFKIEPLLEEFKENSKEREKQMRQIWI